MKRLALFLSILAFIVNSVIFWYFDSLFDRFWIFALFPVAISVVLLIVALIISLIEIFKNRSKLTSYIALAITVVTILLVFFFPFRDARVRTELYLFEDNRMKVIEMVRNGEIVPDLNGNAEIPAPYGYTSSDGNIYIFQNDEEQVVCFWVFRGMLSGSVQLIYSSGDARLIYANETGHPITDVTQLKAHWYLVQTDY